MFITVKGGGWATGTRPRGFTTCGMRSTRSWREGKPPRELTRGQHVAVTRCSRGHYQAPLRAELPAAGPQLPGALRSNGSISSWMRAEASAARRSNAASPLRQDKSPRRLNRLPGECARLTEAVNGTRGWEVTRGTEHLAALFSVEPAARPITCPGDQSAAKRQTRS